MGTFPDALQLRACSLQVSCRCYALFRRPGEGAGRSPLCGAVAQAEVATPHNRSPAHDHQSCVGQAARRTRLLVQGRNYSLLAPTGTEGQRSALPRDLGVSSRITGKPETTLLGNVIDCAEKPFHWRAGRGQCLQREVPASMAARM